MKALSLLRSSRAAYPVVSERGHPLQGVTSDVAPVDAGTTGWVSENPIHPKITWNRM
jgi:hypothetical protein